MKALRQRRPEWHNRQATAIRISLPPAGVWIYFFFLGFLGNRWVEFLGDLFVCDVFWSMSLVLPRKKLFPSQLHILLIFMMKMLTNLNQIP